MLRLGFVRYSMSMRLPYPSVVREHEMILHQCVREMVYSTTTCSHVAVKITTRTIAVYNAIPYHIIPGLDCCVSYRILRWTRVWCCWECTT